MDTLVCFHAHPDDESIATGGVMAQAAAEGRRVVLVLGTRGELGEVDDGFLDEGETLGDRRVKEVAASAETLGVARVEYLGYIDSGMMGLPTNDDPACFWQADVDEAAGRLAAILEDEAPVRLTVYDDHGGYGHPDHIQVHRVGIRAAELAGVDHVFEATMNRDAMRRSFEEHKDDFADVIGEDELPPTDGPDAFGTPEVQITHAVDVSEFAGAKRASMRCHASQISEDDFFLRLPDEMFVEAFGQEWFIARGQSRPEDAPFVGSLFD
jgi:LmbE family N-acetylglucosaminyl deacetylase